MDSRLQKAHDIADKFRITEAHGRWTVPSQSGPGKYSVIIQNHTAKCECAHFELRRGHCKHILAVQILIDRASFPTDTTGKTAITAARRKTYPQNWRAYNTAQTTEGDTFQALLQDLCSGVTSDTQPRRGRPSLPVSDALFSAVLKVYSTFSGRRFMSELREAERRGMISKTPHYNSIFNYLENPLLTPILKEMIIRSSMPLKSVETEFACDSSGFSTNKFVRWYDHKYGAEKLEHDWVKVHIMCGVKTNIVTAVEIHGRSASDSKQFPALMNKTRENFQMKEISADKAYLSYNNAALSEKLGAIPFIAFKTNSVTGGHNGGSHGNNRRWTQAWDRMFHYFQFRREEFLTHYHKRSNVETTFSMIKRKFGDGLRSKSDTAMVNEALCKILCHNIVVLIHEICELGIEPIFWAEMADAQQMNRECPL